jgi:site-specific recombinase XerD
METTVEKVKHDTSLKTKKKQKNYILTPERFLSRDERKKLIKHCQEHAEFDLLRGRMTWPVRYMLIDLALYSGLRVGEMAVLKIGDIYLKGEDSYIIVRHGKGNRMRTVYMDSKLAVHLKEYIKYKSRTLKQSIDAESPLFSGRNAKHSQAITLMKSFKVAITTCGLRQSLSIHSCRHTYATFLLQGTGNLRYVQRQLGHSDITMTSLYADILPEENGPLANKISRDE